MSPASSIAVAFICYLALRSFRKFFFESKSDVERLSGPEPNNRFLGNTQSLRGPESHAWQDEMFKKYGRVWKMYGPFMRQDLFINDPLALQHIYMKDQYLYEPTTSFRSFTSVIFGKVLTNTTGAEHRRQRKLLNPTFSISHIRTFCPKLYEIAYQLRDQLELGIGSQTSAEIDVFDLISSATLESIGQTGFGHSFNVFSPDQAHNEYLKAVRGLLRSFQGISLAIPFMSILVKLGPPNFRRWFVDHSPFPGVHVTKHIVNTLHDISYSIYESKKRSLEKGEESVSDDKQNDIMSALLKANKNSNEDDRVADEDLLGQMSLFIFAGYETTASALARLLQLLAQNSKVQTNLREEIFKSREQNGDLHFDEIMALPYMDAVVRETLRLYPPGNTSTRETAKDVVLPLSTPVKTSSGDLVSELLLKKGTIVTIGVRSANRDPAIWGEDAEEWKPERWVGCKPEEVVKEKLPGVYSGLMTFIGGSRACIGFKFAELEMKIFLSVLLEQFVFEPSKRDAEVSWKTFAIMNPTLDGKTQLPLKVTRINQVEST